MTCRDVATLLTRFVDGELDEARASALRGHLRGCAGCRARVEDEALVRDTMAGLDPIEPPAELWSGIQERLAAAETADAGRSRAWLWWQRLRPHALSGAVALVAAGVLVLWLVRRGGDQPAADGEGAAVTAIAEQPAPPPAPAPVRVRGFEEVRGEEVARADATYAGAIADLRELVDGERAGWSAEQARRFDTQLAALDAEVARHRGAAADPVARRPLYAAMQAQITLLEGAVLGDLP